MKGVGYIYKIARIDETDEQECYIGSTCDINMRIKSHKLGICKKDARMYKYIRDNGGLDEWTFYVIERTEIKDRSELYDIENRYISVINPYLNTINPCIEVNEWREKDGYVTERLPSSFMNGIM